MQLTIIGSGTGTPQKGRSAPCCLIRHENESAVVDIGSGATRGILVYGDLSARDIGLILITHLHPDHCSDLATFLFALRASEMARTEALPIFGPKGLKSHYQALRNLWGRHVDPLDYELLISEWINGQEERGPFRVRAERTSHSVTNLAWMIETQKGPGIMLTGDGEPTEELVKMGRSSRHVLVAECSLPVGEKAAGHMNPGQAGDLALRCCSMRLILTHMNPEVQAGPAEKEARKHFSGEVIIAEDGMKIDV